jgi:hypothetical protein
VTDQVTFLHTSAAHIETFEHLVKALAPGVRTNHVVAEDLLADAQVVGAGDASLVVRIQKAMIDAAGSGAPLVVCTCSTIGEAAERTPTNGRFQALRIDRAMAERAVRSGPDILVVAALDSTLLPTIDLIREAAVALRRDIAVRHLVVADAWRHFIRGDREAYVRAVVEAIRREPVAADVVVLAQASMALAAERLQDLGVEVLSSPALGVKDVLDRLQGRS